MINTLALKGKIVESGYNQRSLAKQLGMNKNTLNSKINGSSHFNIEEVNKICSVLGIETADEKCHIFLHESSQ